MKARKWKPGDLVSFNYRYSERPTRYEGRLVRRYDGGSWKIDLDDTSLPTTFAHESTFKPRRKT